MPFMRVLVVLPFLIVAAHRVSAQVPTEFSNLQVLPKNITRAELLARMRTLASELGVGCNHCHVGPSNLQGMDFATDQKRTKQVARTMLRMVRDINDNYVRTIPEAAEATGAVTCFTCHRRSLKPTRALHEILFDTASNGGASSALSRYDILRTEFYGSGLYDFREHTLNILGNRLRDERKMLADAYAIFRKNAELFPASAAAQFIAGQAAHQAGDLAVAEKFYRRVLAIQPTHAGAQQALARMKNGGDGQD